MEDKETRKITPEFYEKAARYFTGDMSEEELQHFEQLCQSVPSLTKEREKLGKIWEATGNLESFDTIAGERAYDKVMKRIHHSVKPKRNFLYYLEKSAAVLFIPLFLLSLVYYLTNKPIREQQNVFNEIDNAYGTVSKLVLPDGTRVWLNSGSHIKYPLYFMHGIRKVHLDGEAFFEVAKDKKRPFIVETSQIDVIATGTVFDVMAYSDENRIVSTLVSGKIVLAKETGKSRRFKTLVSVKPGYQAVLDKTQKEITLRQTDVDKVIAWKEGKLIFRDDPMDVVVRKLNRWYNADIVLMDNELNAYRYTATFVDETLPQILELLKHSAPIDYKVYKRKKKADNSFTKEKVEIRIRKNYRMEKNLPPGKSN